MVRHAHGGESRSLHPLIAQIAAFLTFLLVLLAIRWRGVQLIDTTYLGGFDGDAGLYSWLTRISTWPETNGFYPYGLSRAWSDNFLLPMWICQSLAALGFSDIFSYNITLLAAQLLNGFSLFLLCHALTASFLPSCIAGIALLCSSYLTWQMGHPQLQFVFWIPLALLAFLKSQEGGSLRWGLLLAISVIGAFLSATYYAVFIVFALGVLLLCTILLSPIPQLRSVLGALLVGAALSAIALLPVIGPYLSVREVFGERHSYETAAFAASPLSFFAGTPWSSLYSSTSTLAGREANFFGGVLLFLVPFIGIFSQRHLLCRTRTILFLLSLVMGIALCRRPEIFNSAHVAASILLWLSLLFWGWQLLRLRGRALPVTSKAVLLLLSLHLVSVVTAMGPLGAEVRGETPFAPAWVVQHLVPGFGAIRAVSRLHVLALIAMTGCLGLLLSGLATRRRTVIALCIGILVVMENDSTTYPLQTPTPPPSILSSIQQAPSGVAIVLPYAPETDGNGLISSWTQFANLQTRALHWFLSSGRKVINGYSGQQTKVMRELPRELRSFPSERSLRALSAFAGLSTLLYLPTFDKNFDETRFLSAVATFPNQLRIIEKDSQGNFLLAFSPRLSLLREETLLLPATASGVHLNITRLVANEDARVLVYGDESVEPLRFHPQGENSELIVQLSQAHDSVRPRYIRLQSEPAGAFVVKGAHPIFLPGEAVPR